MQAPSRGRRVVPLALGVAMLAVAITAAFAPNLGAVPAQRPASYGQGNSTGSSGLGVGVIEIVTAVVIIAAVLALAFVLLRRRRPPAATAPVQPGPGKTGPAAPPEGPPGTPPPATAPDYVEQPKDVGQEPPAIPVATGAEAGVGAAAADEAELDTDSLKAELDRLSEEVRKRSQKKGGPPPIEPTDEENPR